MPAAVEGEAAAEAEARVAVEEDITGRVEVTERLRLLGLSLRKRPRLAIACRMIPLSLFLAIISTAHFWLN